MDLKKYICTIPFDSVTIHNENEQYFCCKQWLDVPLNFDDGWESEDAKNVRSSMLDGSFKYCSTTNCPHLSTLIKLNRKPNDSPIIEQTQFNKRLTNISGPKNVRFTFDSACNLACPSCRKDFIKNTEELTTKSNGVLNKLYEKYGKTIETVSLSGYGDPFYSVPMLDFLKTINKERLPNLKKIHLHTNGILWNEKNWEKIKNSHDYIETAEISIDASTDETYKKVRIGGNWNLLMENLAFINNIKTVKKIIVSFVIQRDNYNEMCDFYRLMSGLLYNKDLTFLYHSIHNWGVMSDEKYMGMKVWDKTHSEYDLFQTELEKLKSIGDKRILISMD